MIPKAPSRMEGALTFPFSVVDWQIVDAAPAHRAGGLDFPPFRL